MHELDVLKRALDRERRARKQAEALLEDRSRELYCANQELKELTDALREQSHRTQAILDTAAEGIITIDQQGIVESFNPAAERIFGYASAEFIGKNIKMLMPAPHSELHDTYLANYLATGNSQVLGIEREIQGLRKDGTTFPIEVSISELVIGDRRIFTGIVRDVTRRKHLETQLAHAQKMESVGQLAAGIAHEINTPIQYVGDNTRFLHDAFGDLSQLLSLYEQLEQVCEQDDPPQAILQSIQATVAAKDVAFVREEIPKALDQTLEGAQRVARIVRAMREFSHPGSKEKHAVDLNQAIESTTIVTRNEWKYVAELITDFDPDLPPVACLADEFNQVILNLIVNAAHAIAETVEGSDEKGTITITTRAKSGWAEIRVADTGRGISEKHRSRIFDPFFTTKPVGKGTGQGLAIVYSVIVERHAGAIDFVTNEGKGTTFILRLPLENSTVRSGEVTSEALGSTAERAVPVADSMSLPATQGVGHDGASGQQDWTGG
ncbi:MAG: PAS domain S-box protein [Planctomycetota bacterium]|nr:PAS domain S-box protein [Planctomycetota bacterium]